MHISIRIFQKCLMFMIMMCVFRPLWMFPETPTPQFLLCLRGNAELFLQNEVSVLFCPICHSLCLCLRPSGGRLLPLRPPPIKAIKPAGSSFSPAATNQLPSSRVPKRAPPLPPRPKPGHPLYKRYSVSV